MSKNRKLYKKFKKMTTSLILLTKNLIKKNIVKNLIKISIKKLVGAFLFNNQPKIKDYILLKPI